MSKSRVVRAVESLIDEMTGLPEYVYAIRVVEAARSEILQLETEAEYYRTLCEGYERIAL
jgi:hypothetical protein